jgi:hypothetical protein
MLGLAGMTGALCGEGVGITGALCGGVVGMTGGLSVRFSFVSSGVG